ncbi:hypothetical protein WJR50_01645 [Catalinimonas sp. 4WD22]
MAKLLAGWSMLNKPRSFYHFQTEKRTKTPDEIAVILWVEI